MFKDKNIFKKWDIIIIILLLLGSFTPEIILGAKMKKDYNIKRWADSSSRCRLFRSGMFRARIYIKTRPKHSMLTSQSNGTSYRRKWRWYNTFILGEKTNEEK